jgi:mannose-6-phosphate isomerase
VVDVLEPVVQPYAWGSRYAIAEIQGRPAPAPGPEAELWMGAHLAAPSGLHRDGRPVTLDQVIAADPERELGPACTARFGPRLPFLLKILAPEKALSIQVHPDRAQAEAGYRAEAARGVRPRDRNYADDWPKPELLCALTRFEALAGFRPTGDILALLAELDVPELRPVAAGLAAAPGPGGQAAALRRILGWPTGQRDQLLAGVLAACARVAAAGGRYAAACGAVLRIATDHPGDLGLVAALLLEYTVLQPGEALYMAAGGLHAYIKGVGVELMANSDNVLRAGLTGKRIDIPELLKLVDPAVPVPVIHPRQLAPHVAGYDTPAPEFRLYRVEPAGGDVPLPDAGPRIVLCIDGTATLRASSGAQSGARSDARSGEPSGDPVKLGRGESCFIPAADGEITAAGHGELFVAASGCGG